MFEALKQFCNIFSRRDKIVFAILLILMSIGALLEVLGVGLIPVFVGIISNSQKLLSMPILEKLINIIGITNPTRLLIVGSLTLIGINLFKNVYLILNTNLQLRVIKNRQVSLSQRLFTLYMNAPYEFHMQRNSAELLRNVNNEVQLLCGTVLVTLLSVIMNSLIAFGILCMLLWVEPVVSMTVAIILGGAGGLFLWKFNNKMNDFGKSVIGHRKGLVQAVNQGLGGIKEARIGHREHFFINSFLQSARQMAIAEQFQGVTGQATTYFLEAVAVTVMLILSILLVLIGRAPESIAPTLALFAIAIIRLRANVNLIVSGFNQLNYRIHSISPIYNDIKLLENINVDQSTDPGHPVTFNDCIEIKELFYSYPGTETFALRGINLKIAKGSSVGFVGATGAGKTTLIDIILGLLPPTEGSVCVDGVDIRKNLYSWQSMLGYVPQTIFLTDDTIRRNIALGIKDEEIDNKKVWEALRAAQLEEFVTSLPEGLETNVGERGVRISGGQRQRIGIARALYNNPEILVLDEGTSALDNSTEQAVVSAVERMQGTRTIIMIAHRLSTVKNCDMLFFMNHGRLECSGNYDELLSMNDHFKSLAGI